MKDFVRQFSLPIYFFGVKSPPPVFLMVRPYAVNRRPYHAGQ